MNRRDRSPDVADVAAHLGEEGLAPKPIEPWRERFGEEADYARELRAELGLGADAASMIRARALRFSIARPLTRRLLTSSLLVLTGMIAGIVWFNHLQPLQAANLVAHANPEAVDAGGQTEFRWVWSKGGEFVIGTWLTNTGDLPVRVTRLEPAEQELFVAWDNWRITAATDQGAAVPTIVPSNRSR